jgi:phage terminase large subunit
MSELDGIHHPIPPEDWKVFRSIDFGYPSPMVVQWWAKSPDDTFVMFREFYQSSTLVEDAAEMIKMYSEDLQVNQTFADPAQASDRETLQRNGVSSSKAKKDVWNGIQEVKGVLSKDKLYFYEDALVHRPDESLDEDKKPNRTVDEIPGYEWKDKADDRPQKKDDHGCDAMRYCIYSILGNGSTIDEDFMEEMESMFNDGF